MTIAQTDATSRRYQTRLALILFLVAACLAPVGVYRRLTGDQEQRTREAASDNWQRYQNHRIRFAQSQLARDLMKASGLGDIAQYDKNVMKEEVMSRELQVEAQRTSESADLARRQSVRLRMGQVLLELALGVAALGIFKRSRMVWISAVSSAVLGAITAVSALWI